MSGSERRRHVRTKPTADLPARAVLVIDALVQEALDVHDISVGGMAIGIPGHARPQLGDRLEMKLALANKDQQRVTVTVRWTNAATMGVAFEEPVPETLSWYVGELLERGAS